MSPLHSSGSKRLAFLVGSGISLALPATSPALGLRIPDQDPFATARGNAFVATANNPSAIYYNPAGLAFLEGVQLRLGAYSINLESKFVSAAGARTDTTDKIQLVPQLYYSHALEGKPFTFGLGFYSPYGLGMEWPENPAFGALFGKITYLSVNPTLAWRVDPTLSIAVGLTVNQADLKVRQGTVGGAVRNELTGDDLDLGYTFGLMWRPHEQHSFGVSYRSPTTMHFRGTSTTTGVGTFPADARFPFPRHIAAGWSYRPTPKWNLEFNADWTEWKRLTTVGVNSTPAGTFPFNWRSSWFYEWGATRSFEGGWQASAGYIFSENSVPDANFSPLVPDSDRHIFSLGVGRQHGRLNWDLGYQFAWGPERTVSGAAFGALGGNPNGRYTFYSHALTGSLGFTF